LLGVDVEGIKTPHVEQYRPFIFPLPGMMPFYPDKKDKSGGFISLNKDYTFDRAISALAGSDFVVNAGLLFTVCAHDAESYTSIVSFFFSEIDTEMPGSRMRLPTCLNCIH